MHVDERNKHWLDFPRTGLCCAFDQFDIPISYHVGMYSTQIRVRLTETFSQEYSHKCQYLFIIRLSFWHFLTFMLICNTQVLITKLRSANTVETRQYRKASKALLVLIPLLGITYLVVIAGPNEGVGSYIFIVARAILLSTQVSKYLFAWKAPQYSIYPICMCSWVPLLA